MWCFITFKEIFFLTSQKGGGIVSVNYLKVKKDATYATPNFSFLSS